MGDLDPLPDSVSALSSPAIDIQVPAFGPGGDHFNPGGALLTKHSHLRTPAQTEIVQLTVLSLEPGESRTQTATLKNPQPESISAELSVDCRSLN